MKKITVVLIVMIGFILFPSDSLAATIVNQSKKYTFSEMQKDIFALQERYPFLEVTSIGESTEGRDIYKITLGEGTQKMMINGGHHGREWVSSLLTMKKLETYADAYEKNKKIGNYDIRYLADRIAFVFVPMTNPDGVEISIHGPTIKQANYFRQIHGKNLNWHVWKANAIGIDPNKNYNYLYEKDTSKPDIQGYTGKGAETAVETKAMADDVRKNQYCYTISYHSSGQIIYWYVNQRGTRKSSDLQYVKAVAKETGYRIIQPGSENSYKMGYTDYIVGKLKKPAITIEVAPSKYAGKQVSLSAFPSIWKQNKEVGALISTMVGKTFSKNPSTPTIDNLTTDSTMLTGKATKGLTIYAVVDDYVIAKGKVATNGAYKLVIPSQQAGTIVTVYVETKDFMRSKKASQTVHEAPIIEPVEPIDPIEPVNPPTENENPEENSPTGIPGTDTGVNENPSILESIGTEQINHAA